MKEFQYKIKNHFAPDLIVASNNNKKKERQKRLDY